MGFYFQFLFFMIILYNLISYVIFWFKFADTRNSPLHKDMTDESLFIGKSQVFLKSDLHYPRKIVDLSNLQDDVSKQRVIYL